MALSSLLNKNLLDIGKQWYRTTFSVSNEIEKTQSEDSKVIKMEDGYWDNPEPITTEEKFHNGYSPICQNHEIFIEHENLEPYGFFLVLANKWRHVGGMTADRGLLWQDISTLIKLNIDKKKSGESYLMLYL